MCVFGKHWYQWSLRGRKGHFLFAMQPGRPKRQQKMWFERVSVSPCMSLKPHLPVECEASPTGRTSCVQHRKARVSTSYFKLKPNIEGQRQRAGERERERTALSVPLSFHPLLFVHKPNISQTRLWLSRRWLGRPNNPRAVVLTSSLQPLSVILYLPW